MKALNTLFILFSVAIFAVIAPIFYIAATINSAVAKTRKVQER
jgi:hypothetical protein